MASWVPGVHVFGLENGGVGYATSGGFVDDIAARLDAYAADIEAGEITVPETP
jgi:basic membrane protein A